MKNTRIVFATFVSDQAERLCARLLVESLRAFGGTMRKSPFWVFSTNQYNNDTGLISSENVNFFTLQGENQGTQYLFEDKVRAWVQAESYAKEQFDTLIWLDPACLVINPPKLFKLDNETRAAFRPVHVRNVGQLFSQNLDPFWRSIFTQCDTPDPSFTVNSFIDDQVIYPYFNTHCFSIAPRMGVLVKTLNHLNILNSNPEFMNTFCSDKLHKIFLFQAVLAVTLLKEVSEKQIRLLPPGYSYPLHLVEKIPAELAIKKLDELTVMVYEEISILEDSLSKLEISLSKRQWLENFITIR